MNELLERLEQLPFWSHLSDDEKQMTESLSVIRDFDKGNILHAMDKDCLGLAVVLKGSVRAYMMSEEGREITLYHILEGEWDVLTASCIMYQITFDTQMVIEEDSRIMVVPTTALARLKEENVYVRSFIYESLTERFSDVMWTMQQILFYGIDQRIAAFLVHRGMEQGCFSAKAMEAFDAEKTRPGVDRTSGSGRGSDQKSGSDRKSDLDHGSNKKSGLNQSAGLDKKSGVDQKPGVDQSSGPAEIPDCPEIRVTHEEIAREISTAREVVARIIKNFIKDGLIETGRGKIKIKDPKGLYQLAEDLL